MSRNKLRVFFMLSRDPMFKPRMLLELASSDDYEIVGVAEVQAPKRGGLASKIKNNIRFWGLKGFFWIAAIHILTDHFARSKLVPFAARWHMSLEGIAVAHDLQYFNVADIKGAGFKESVRDLNPDIIVSFQHQIFDQELISLPKIAALNCHPALLPKYRGVKPIFWALKEDEPYAGVSVHYLTEKIDAGAVVASERFSLGPKLSLYMFYRVAHAVASRVILNAIREMDGKAIADFTDVNADEQYFGEPDAASVRDFKKMGKNIFDLNR